MKKWLAHTRAELQEVYGENYPRFVKSQLISLIFFLGISLFWILTSHPTIVKALGIWGICAFFVGYMSVILFIISRLEVKLDPKKKQQFKKTKYFRRVLPVIFFMFILIVNLSSLFLSRWIYEQPQPIPQAITTYDYTVNLPSQLPFTPTKEEAVVKASFLYYDLEVSYEEGDTRLDIYISKEDEEELFLSNATLQNGIKADYEEFDDPEERNATLTWYQDGFRYQLNYSPSKGETPPSKEVMLNIANSAKPVHP